MTKSFFCYLILCFTLLFGVIFYDFIDKSFHFSFIDEIICLILIHSWILNGVKQREFIIFICVALFYLGYSLWFPNNVQKAIVMDFFIQIKPFLAFYATYGIGFVFSDTQRQSICKLSVFFAILLAFIGILSLTGSTIMYTFCAHPSRFATMCTALSMTYLYFSQNTQRSKKISLLILTIGLMSFRSKFFGFFPIFVLIIFWGNQLNKFKIISIKTLVILSIMLSTSVYFAWDKIEFYFITGSSYDIEHTYARPLLYMKAAEILKDNPFFGSGLGTYATYASAVYYSPLYTKYQMIYNYEIGNGLFLCDTFYPSLVQFGLVGICLFILFWKKRLQKALWKMRFESSIFTFQFILLITIFFLIESFADSTFTHNRGMYMMMLMAICLSNPPKESWS